MLYRIKRDYFDVENDAGEISPNRASSYYPSYMYFRNFIFSDGPGLSGMVDFWVVSHPAFTKPTYKVNTTAIHYAKNELRGTRYKFEDDRLEIYTQTMADQDAAEALEKKYLGKIRGIVKTIIIPMPGEAKKGLPPMPLTVKVKFSFVYMGRLWSVHRSIQTVQDDPDNPMSPWRYKINDADDIYRKYSCSDYETGRSITAGEYNPNGAKRAAERTLSEAGPERLKAAVEKGKVINPLPALALAIIKEMPTRAKKPSEAVPKDKGTLAPEGGPGPVEAAPSPAEAAPGTREAPYMSPDEIARRYRITSQKAQEKADFTRTITEAKRVREASHRPKRERKPPKTEDEYWAEQKALQKKKNQEILDRPDIPDYDPDTDTAPEIPEYDPGEGEA